MVAGTKWNDLALLPVKEGDGWALWKNGRQVDVSLSEIASLVARWLPANQLLIGAPGEKRFLPPILVPECENTALRAVRNNSRNMIFAFFACGLAVAGMSVTRPTSHAFSFGLLSIAIGTIIAIDYRLGLRSRDALAERALFCRWLKVDSSARLGFLIWLVFTVGLGVTQLILERYLGGLDSVFYHVGTMYADVNAGQYWRLISGPYLHYSLSHYLINATFLLSWGTLSFAIFKRLAFVVFIVGNAFTAFAQMTFGGNAFDNYGGISGGIYTLLGMLVAAGAIKGRQLFPRGLGWLIFNLTMLGVVGSEVTSENAATAAHLSGILLGGAVGAYYSQRLRALN